MGGMSYKDWGEGSPVISLGATTATGSKTIYPISNGPYLKTVVHVEVDAYATGSNWGGTLSVSANHGSLTEAATTVVVSGLTASGSNGYKTMTTLEGYYTSIAISVAGNDKVCRVYAYSYGALEEGAA